MKYEKLQVGQKEEKKYSWCALHSMPPTTTSTASPTSVTCFTAPDDPADGH